MQARGCSEPWTCRPWCETNRSSVLGIALCSRSGRGHLRTPEARTDPFTRARPCFFVQSSPTERAERTEHAYSLFIGSIGDNFVAQRALLQAAAAPTGPCTWWGAPHGSAPGPGALVPNSRPQEHPGRPTARLAWGSTRSSPARSSGARPPARGSRPQPRAAARARAASSRGENDNHQRKRIRARAGNTGEE